MRSQLSVQCVSATELQLYNQTQKEKCGCTEMQEVHQTSKGLFTLQFLTSFNRKNVLIGYGEKRTETRMGC